MVFKDLAKSSGFMELSPDEQRQQREKYFVEAITTKPGFSDLTPEQQQEIKQKFDIKTEGYLTPVQPKTETQFGQDKSGYFYSKPPESEIITDPLTKPPTQDLSMGPTPQELAKTLMTPVRGWGALGVAASRALNPIKAIERAGQYLASPGEFTPETKKEAVGKFAGEVIGMAPLFTVSASLVGTGSLGLGVTLGGLSALEQKELKDEVAPGEVMGATALGMAFPPAAKIMMKGLSIAAPAVAKTVKTGLEKIKFTTKDPESQFLRNSAQLAAAEAEVTKAPIKAMKDPIGGGINAFGDDMMVTMNRAGKGDQKVQTNLYEYLTNKARKWLTGNTPESIKELIAKRGGNAAVETFESQYFQHQIIKNLSEAERNAMSLYVETGRVPKELLNKLPNKQITPVMGKWKPLIRAWLDKDYGKLKDVFDDASYLADYIPHIWDLPKKAVTEKAGAMAMKTPFLKQRRISNLEEGMKQGLKPKTLDIAEIIGIYDNYRIRAIANQEFIRGIKTMKNVDGQSLIQAVDKAPAGWPKISHKALDPSEVPVAVHPDIKRALNVVLSKPWDAQWLRNVEAVKGVVKKMNMSFSLFHHTALGESLAAALGPKRAIKANADIMAMAMKGELPIFKNIDATKDALKHGVVLGHMPEFAINQIQQLFKTTANKVDKIPGLKPLVKTVGKFNDLWDRGLWDYMHNGYKLVAYEHMLAKNLQVMSNKSITEVKRLTADQVNNLMGGQNWDRLLIHPKFRQALNLVFMAPDWNISAMRQGLDAFKAGAAGDLPRKYWGRALIYMYGISNVINYGTTKQVTGKGRWMWENEEGSQSKIFVGKDEDGRNVYVRQGKQFREPFEFLDHMPAFLGRKLAPTMHVMWEQISGTSTTGFPLEFKDKGFYEGIPERTKSIAAKLLPFSFSDTNFGFALPKSKGASKYWLVQEFTKAIEKDDKERTQKLRKMAAQNSIDPKPLYQIAKGKVTSKKKKEILKTKKGR
jgi:hypothetical protein